MFGFWGRMVVRAADVEFYIGLNTAGGWTQMKINKCINYVTNVYFIGMVRNLVKG